MPSTVLGNGRRLAGAGPSDHVTRTGQDVVGGSGLHTARARSRCCASGQELDQIAQDRDLQGRSTMDKDELVEALRHDDRTHELRRQS
jgi:hypothetical protein